MTFQPRTPIDLDRYIFGEVLRKCRKGQSAGMWGARYEHYKICLEDDVAFDCMCECAEILSRGRLPEQVRETLQPSVLTALHKETNSTKIRGIAAGDTFRRLVSKTLA